MRMPIAFATASVLAAVSLSAQNGAAKILSVDHKVTVKSIVPAIAGEPAQIYVRERVADGMKNSAADRVVLFVHGAGTPAEVAFDVPTGDYSWMAFLAKNGFDVFSMDRKLWPIVAARADERIRATCPTSSRSNFVPKLIPASARRRIPANSRRSLVPTGRHRRVRRSHSQFAQRAEGRMVAVVAWAARAPAARRSSIPTR